MLSGLFSVVFLLSCVSLIFFGIKRNKQKVLISLGIGIITFLLVGLFSSEPVSLKLDQTNIETDKNGLATISGQTNKGAKLELDGQKLTLDKDGYFSHDIQLTDELPKTQLLRSRVGNDELTEKVTISASSSFKKQLALIAEKEEAERLAKLSAEKVAQAEKEVETAITLAENELTEKNYSAAKSLLISLETPPKELVTRLGILGDELTAQLQLDAQKATAEEALALAEKEPTEQHYESAKSAIGVIPPGQQQVFTNRLATIKGNLENQVQTETSPPLQTEAVDEPTNAESSMMVLVTPTGKKYHSYVCGNGTYTEATLDTAQSRGLTACSKCF